MNRIKLLTREGCGQCLQAKRMLDAKSFLYDVVDCDTEEGEAYVKKYNLRQVPAMEVDGKVIYRNLREIKLFIDSYSE